MPTWLHDLLPILILLAVVAVVIARLPKVEGLTHSAAYRRRRLMNWLPLGLTYSFLYFGRYNLEVAKRAFGAILGPSGSPLMTNADFATVFGIGTTVYAVSFLLNGPLTDRFGGKRAILVGAGGAALCNLGMGLVTLTVTADPASPMAASLVAWLSVLYGVNMYFQSFGAVAIVKVNAPWFHVRERGVFGAIFGILISLGIYFAFDWSALLLKANLPLESVFFVPAALLALFWVLSAVFVRDTPAQAGHQDFDTGDASSGEGGPTLGAVAVFKMMLRNPVILTIAGVEFCSGFLRQAIMQWYRTFAKQTDFVLGGTSSFVYENWGLMLCCAGILGGVVAGVISDHLFQSRRGPVAAILYSAMLVGGVALAFLYTTPAVGAIVVFMSLCVIGVHGMLSGTASMDFGGRKNAGIAVGIIDGFVYAGTACMSLVYGLVLPKDQLDAAGKLTGPATIPENWLAWPLAMIPIALLGLVLAARVWNAKPKSGAGGH